MFNALAPRLSTASRRCFLVAVEPSHHHAHAAALGLRRFSRLADCLARARTAGSARRAPFLHAGSQPRNRQVDGIFDAFGFYKADRRVAPSSTSSLLDRISDRIGKVLVYLSTEAVRL